MDQSQYAPRAASRALTKTGGYLSGFTYTLQPYIGCRFACSYCYVQELSVHRFHKPKVPWGQYVHPRIGISDLLHKEVAHIYSKRQEEQLTIFMSSVTDPYQGLERKWKLTRSCLEVLVEYQPKHLMIQTRAPLVQRDFDLIARLEANCWLSITLETDREDVRRKATPHCPSVAQRLDTLAQARQMGLNVQIAVSPCLPYSSVEKFGSLLMNYANRIVVDSYVSGDGQSGRRTARTQVPHLHEQQQWPPWYSETEARQLYEWLERRQDSAVGWSQRGFTALVTA